MKNYLCNFEGLNKKVWQKAETETKATKIIWDSLLQKEKNKVTLIDVIKEKEVTTVKDIFGVCLLGVLFAAMFVYGIPAKAQQIQMTDSRGYNQGTIQINGNTAQFVNPMGYTTQTATIYPNQVVITTPNGYTQSVVGNTGYTVPPSPPTPMSPRVMQ